MVTEQGNLQIVQALFAAFGRGDLASVLAALSDDIEWSVTGPREVAYAGTWRGREQVTQFFQTLGASVEMLQFEPREFIPPPAVGANGGLRPSGPKCTCGAAAGGWDYRAGRSGGGHRCRTVAGEGDRSDG